MKTEKWKMPKWMEPYRDKIVGNGEAVEVLMNTSGEQANVYSNAPLAMICVGVKNQVGLLMRLHEDGKL
jgi:hypothetical protein